MSAAAQSQAGTLALNVDVPNGGVALVEIRDANGSNVLRSLVVDADRTVNVVIAAGTYRIVPRQVSVNNERFVGKSQPLSAHVSGGITETVAVEYVRSLGVQNLQVTQIGQTDVSIHWDAARGEGTTAWRTDGDHAPTRARQGTQVPLTDAASLRDTGLKPGGVYTYSIFARPGDGSFGRDDVDPVSITVRTASTDPATPLFVLSPDAQILSPQDFTPYSGGNSLVLDLAAGVPTPRPGSVLAVPVSAALPGGYLGEVKGISDDGRQVRLVTAPMASAFDLYHLAVSDIAALPLPAYQPGAPAPDNSGMTPAAFSAAAFPTECSGSGNVTLTPSLSESHAGHADITIDKHHIVSVDVPSGLSYDFGYSTTLKATVDVVTTGSATCGLKLPRFFRNLSFYPVPVAIDAQPKAELSLLGKLAVKNLGGVVTAGFDTYGQLPIGGLPNLGGKLSFNTKATQPVSSEEAGLGLLVDGSVTFGPGLGSSDVGVIAGLSGNFSPLDATVSIVKVVNGGVSSTCAKVEAKVKTGLSATLKAWIPGYAQDYTVKIAPLQGAWDWPGSPFYYPTNCEDSQTPTNDVVGPGVTVVSDGVTGQANQFGKVNGFVPGQNTWVLSTGRVDDLVGVPSTFASTNLGGDGNAALSGLSGYPTYDASSYKVTLVPNGHTLVVRYAFGSEEYPEYVGSSYNDVMGVFVNGVNCALVPGTSTPVSINSINQYNNSQYYVDNSQGAAGYHTTLDGLTVPLECRVPVTPGKQVTVEIAVADASDHAYDSAVALLDGGIYSE